MSQATSAVRLSCGLTVGWKMEPPPPGPMMRHPGAGGGAAAQARAAAITSDRRLITRYGRMPSVWAGPIFADLRKFDLCGGREEGFGSVAQIRAEGNSAGPSSGRNISRRARRIISKRWATFGELSATLQ